MTCALPTNRTSRVAAGYSDVQLLRVPDVGHSTVSTDQTGCARRAMIEFIATGQAPASCPGSDEAQALPLPPSSLGKVPAAASELARGRAGRDRGGDDARGPLRPDESLRRRAARRLLGARTSRASCCTACIDVPGVALSGTIRVSGSPTGLPAIAGELTVRGRLAGTLTLHGLALSGRVGGTPVHTRLPAL